MKTTPIKSLGTYISQSSDFPSLRKWLLQHCKSNGLQPSRYKTATDLWVFFEGASHKSLFYIASELFKANLYFEAQANVWEDDLLPRSEPFNDSPRCNDDDELIDNSSFADLWRTFFSGMPAGTQEKLGVPDGF